MKKISIAIMIGLLGFSAAHAETTTKKDFSVAVGTSTVMNSSSEMEYKLGYGVTKYFESGIMAGVNFEVGLMNGEKENNYDYSANVKLGYSPIKNGAVYGIGSAIYQSIGTDTSGYGFGYGAGVEYRLTDSFAAAVEYKKYNMTLESGFDYDYDNTSAVLKYTF